jgi:hypothetical protein
MLDASIIRAIAMTKLRNNPEDSHLQDTALTGPACYITMKLLL